MTARFGERTIELTLAEIAYLRRFVEAELIQLPAEPQESLDVIYRDEMERLLGKLADNPSESA